MKNLGFGLMRLPLLDKKDVTSIDERQLCQMVDRFLAQGFTYFDTAYFYHQNASESAARRTLVERYPRERFVLAGKMPTFLVERPEDCQRYFDEQLENCGVSYFDYYLLHTLNADLYRKTKEYGGFAFGKALRDQGKIRHFGFSFHGTPEVLDQILTEQPDVEFVQLQINYIDWESPQVRARECCETARRHGKPIIVMEPVRGGGLARVPEEVEQTMKRCRPEHSIPSWAVRFAASLEGVMMALSGMSDLAQLEDNTSYMRDFVPLDQEEREIIRRAAQAIRSRVAVPCTARRYCVDGCPRHIPIPPMCQQDPVHADGGDRRGGLRNHLRKPPEQQRDGLGEPHGQGRAHQAHLQGEHEQPVKEDAAQRADGRGDARQHRRAVVPAEALQVDRQPGGNDKQRVPEQIVLHHRKAGRVRPQQPGKGLREKDAGGGQNGRGRKGMQERLVCALLVPPGPGGWRQWSSRRCWRA